MRCYNCGVTVEINFKETVNDVEVPPGTVNLEKVVVSAIEVMQILCENCK